MYMIILSKLLDYNFLSVHECTKRGDTLYSSLLAAIAWRDKTEKKIGKVRTDKHVVTVSHTSTGVVGVRLNNRLHRYEISWVKEDGRQGKTTVSINKYGKKQAFSKARAIRKEKEYLRLGISPQTHLATKR